MGSTPFVVQRHEKRTSAHFDLMIRRGDKLATWSFAGMPGEGQVEGRRLFDHRLRYLQFEGELGGKRGRMEIVDQGECEIVRWDERRVEAVFSGLVLEGRYFLVRSSKQTWTMSSELPE